MTKAKPSKRLASPRADKTRASKGRGTKVKVARRRSKRTGHHSTQGGAVAENRPMTPRELLAHQGTTRQQSGNAAAVARAMRGVKPATVAFQ